MVLGTEGIGTHGHAIVTVVGLGVGIVGVVWFSHVWVVHWVALSTLLVVKSQGSLLAGDQVTAATGVVVVVVKYLCGDPWDRK